MKLKREVPVTQRDRLGPVDHVLSALTALSVAAVVVTGVWAVDHEIHRSDAKPVATENDGTDWRGGVVVNRFADVVCPTTGCWVTNNSNDTPRVIRDINGEAIAGGGSIMIPPNAMVPFVRIDLDSSRSRHVWQFLGR